MGILTSLSLEEVRARGSIKDADVLRLRRAFNDDHTISADEAEALMALNEACPIKEPSWGAFYVEALTDYVVFQAKPEGYLVADNAKWLIERISRDGHVDSHTELELLVNILDKARWSPPSLAEFAITQVKHAVVTGAGPLRSGQPLEPGTITPSEVTLLRRILYAFGGDGSVAVTRIEADALIAINRCIEPGKSPAAWTDFFVKAVAMPFSQVWATSCRRAKMPCAPKPRSRKSTCAMAMRSCRIALDAMPRAHRPATASAGFSAA